MIFIAVLLLLTIPLIKPSNYEAFLGGVKAKISLSVLLCIRATKLYKVQLLGLFGSQESLFFFTEGVPSAGEVHQEGYGHKAKLELILGTTLREEDPQIHYNFFIQVKYIHTSSKLYIFPFKMDALNFL